MENHPIPQDVTGFKFRLIGSMTVKQFSYLLAGAIISYMFYTSPVFMLLKYMLIGGTMLFAAALAFVPIDGRPIDKMVFYFIKAIPRENEYVYRKQGAQMFEIMKSVTFVKKGVQKEKPKNISIEEAKRSTFMKRWQKYSPSLDEGEVNFLNKLKPFFEESVFENKDLVYKNMGAQQPIKPPPVNKNVFSPFGKIQPPNIFQRITKEQPHQEKQENVTVPIIKADVPTNQPQNIVPPPAQTIQDIKKQTESSEESLRKDIIDYSAQNKMQGAQKPIIIKQENIQTASVKQVSGSQNIFKAGFPVLPDVPNVVLGIIKDPRGKVLPNIIVEVVDNNNSPVRAFKTNPLGQFISATPLSNGIFKIIIEDPQKQHEFESVEINLNGKDIFLPLEIISVDSRERLRRELFGKN